MNIEIVEKHPEFDIYVSDTGNIYDMDMKEYKNWKDNKGYINVKFSDRPYSVHRLVAQTWIENPENKKEVNHINGIRDDNRKINLEWCTHTENIRKAYTETNTVNVHSTAIIQYTLQGEKIREWDKIKDAAEEVNINRSTISRALRGINKSAGGYIWKYKEEIENKVEIKTNRINTENKDKRAGTPIIQILPDGTEVKWANVSKAAKHIGVSHSSILTVLKGKGKTCKGSSWKYQDEDIIVERNVNIPEDTIPIPNFSKYLISKTGNIYNKETGKKLKAMRDHVHNFYVHLTDDNGKGKCAQYIHRLVVKSYKNIEIENYIVRHINKDKSDNRLENLEYREIQ